jgi:Co/Zn/Cd efflux system component
MVGGGVLYFVGEGPTRFHRYYYSTSTPGLIIGASGLGLTGLGLWLIHRGHSANTSAAATARNDAVSWAVPTLSIDSSHALIGWAGGF